MTVTILASFSLLALVVTGRPLVPATKEAPKIDGPSLDLQNVVQSVFQSRLSSATSQSAEGLASTLKDDHNVHVHVTTVEEQDAVLSELEGLDAVKAIIPLHSDSPNTEDEKKLYELLTGYTSRTAGSLNDLDGAATPLPQELALHPDVSELTNGAAAEAEHEVLETIDQGGLSPLSPFSPTPQLLVLTLSCLAAFVGLGCVVALLFVRRLLGARLIDPLIAWELLPRIEQQGALEPATNDQDPDWHPPEKKELPMSTGPPALRDIAIGQLIDLDTQWNEKVELVTDQQTPEWPSQEEEECSDEQFHDAQGPPLPDVMDISRAIPQITIHEFADPDPLPLPVGQCVDSTPYSTPPPTPPRTPVRRPIQMREAAPSSPLMKPAWSLRAADAPALGLASTTSTASAPTMRSVASTPVSIPRADTPLDYAIPGALATDDAETEKTALEPRTARQRAYRAPVPELDIAFALQLRPGLGLGSDPAWLVRFLMAMFGWMTVLIGGTSSNGRRQERRTIMA